MEEDKPTVVRSYGTKEWHRNGKRHRDGDKPAVIYANGTQEWWCNGKCHRDGDEPAVICADGTKGWYRNGIQYTPEPGCSAPSTSKPDTSTDDVLGALYDCSMGKRDDRDELLRQYKELTGKDRPGFMK